MKPANTVLVSIKTFSDQNLSVMRSVLRSTSQFLEIKKVSSIYRVDRPAESLVSLRDIRKEEYLGCYALVFMANATVEPRDLLGELQDVERRHQKEYLHRSVSINLLMYGESVVMLPGLSIPHPEMHLRPEEIVLSTEVAGEFRHPVLNENLAKLAQQYEGVEWGDFFAQGRPLLDS